MDNSLNLPELVQDIEISTKQELIQELDILRSNNTPGVAVEDFDSDLVESLNECEVIMALAGVRTAGLVNQIYNEYLVYDQYTTWEEFWLSQRESVLRVASTYINLSERMPDNADYAAYKQYLEALGVDWMLGVGRSESEAELLWYKLPREHCRIDLISSPMREQGVEAYSKTERLDGGTASLTVRLILQNLGLEDKTPGNMLVEEGIISMLGAQDIWPYFKIGSRKDNILIRAAMHGSSRPTAHQYKREKEGSLTLVSFISNPNMYKRNKQEFLTKLDLFFTPEIAEQMRVIILEDVPELRFGHEIAETILESIFKYELRTQIGSREATELLASLIAWLGVEWHIAEPGDLADRLSEKMMMSFVAGYYDLISRPADTKLLPYIRGDKVAINRLIEAGAIKHDKDRKVSVIDRTLCMPVISTLVDEVYKIVVSGNKKAHIAMFELDKTA